MQVLFNARHPQATELRDLAERRVRFVLRRLGWLVPRAEVLMSDVNGPVAESTSGARCNSGPMAQGRWWSPRWQETGARLWTTRWRALRGSWCAGGAVAATLDACASVTSSRALNPYA
jgi:hypothetical protein